MIDFDDRFGPFCRLVRPLGIPHDLLQIHIAYPQGLRFSRNFPLYLRLDVGDAPVFVNMQLIIQRFFDSGDNIVQTPALHRKIVNRLFKLRLRRPFKLLLGACAGTRLPA